MDFFLQICEQAKDWIRPHMFFIATALITCTLVASSDIISKQLRRLTSTWPKLFRTVLFIVVTAFGYGSAIVYFTPVLSKILILDAPLLLVILSLMFWMIGTWIESKRL
jgi:hypothetical protein